MNPKDIPAFPCEWDYINSNRQIANGMTLRDYFAAKAMQGMTTTPAFYEQGWDADDMAKQAYMLADAMLEARK